MARSTRHILAAIGLVAAVYLLTLAGLPLDGFWVVDNANKFVQVINILQNPPGDFSIHWPGRALDPAYDYGPMQMNFSAVWNGRLFSQYSPIFAWISAGPYRVLGFPGLYVLPLISSLLMLAGLAALAGLLSPRKSAGVYAVLIGGLCTPVWFYSVIFWEHTLTLCLSVWALWFGLRFVATRAWKSLAVACVLSALSVYFRDDQYLFCLALAIAVAWAARPNRLKTLAVAGLTMTATMIPLWCFQYATMGTALGFHISCTIGQETGGGPLSLSLIRNYLRLRWTVLYNLFFASCMSVPASLLLASPFVLLLVWRPSLRVRAFGAAVPLAGLLSAAAAVWVLARFLGTPIPLVWLLKSNGLFAAAPVVLLGCFSLTPEASEERNARWLWGVGLGYAVLYSLVAPEISSTGVHWGNRFLLLLYPLLCVLAAVNLSEWFPAAGRKNLWRHGLIVLALLLSLLLQIHSIGLLQRKAGYTALLNKEVRSRPEQVIVTDAWWAPQEMYSVMNERMIFCTSLRATWPALSAKLQEAGVHNYLLVTPHPHAHSNVAATVVNDNGLGYFTVRLIPLSFHREIGPDAP